MRKAHFDTTYVVESIDLIAKKLLAASGLDLA
jgi:hypothetical protein